MSLSPAVSLHRTAPIALSFLPTQILPKHHLYCGACCLQKYFVPFWLTWCWECPSCFFLSNNHNFTQVAVAVRLLFDWITSWFDYLRGYSPNSLTLGSSQKAYKLLLKLTDKFSKPLVTFFYFFCFQFYLPLLLMGWKSSLNLWHISLFIPSRSENIVAQKHNAKHSFS